jgi:hypothetical protein
MLHAPFDKVFNRIQLAENSKTDANASGQPSESSSSSSLAHDSMSIDMPISTDKSEGQSVITDSLPIGEELNDVGFELLANLQIAGLIGGEPTDETSFSKILVLEDLTGQRIGEKWGSDSARLRMWRC